MVNFTGKSAFYTIKLESLTCHLTFLKKDINYLQSDTINKENEINQRLYINPNMRHKIENIHKNSQQEINFLEMSNRNNIKSLKSSQKKYQIMALKV